MSTCKPSDSNTSANKGDVAKKNSSSGILSFFCKEKTETVKDECNNNRCPPMPCFNTKECKPAWLCQPANGATRTYPAPPGVRIIPISQGGRSDNSSGSSSGNRCDSCGRTDEGKKSKTPQVKSKDCPMMKPRCPKKEGEVEKKEGGIFARLSSIFGGSKK